MIYTPFVLRAYWSSRHVALLEVHGKEYRLTPIPLRTVRPFVLDEVCLSDAAELEGFDLNGRVAVSKFLKSAVRPFRRISLTVVVICAYRWMS